MVIPGSAYLFDLELLDSYVFFLVWARPAMGGFGGMCLFSALMFLQVGWIVAIGSYYCGCFFFLKG